MDPVAIAPRALPGMPPTAASPTKDEGLRDAHAE